MKKKQPTTQPLIEEPLCQERYLRATAAVTCDGCGDTAAISKGVTYMQHLTANGDRMNLCPRCIFAIKFRQASTREPFEIHPGDLQFDKLPNRYQSAWMRLRKRITKAIHNGAKPNDAWHDACEKLIDELGMRHIYERDCMLAAQAEKFAAVRKNIEKELAALRKNLKSIKADTNAALDRMAKARLSIKVAMTRCQTGGCGACGIADAAEAMQELAAAMVDVRKAWERI
jgi:hypothetical protein